MLTLTATPIPRTLQLALTGVRDLSIIASPPVDRLAVRTFVAPFDPIVVREALLRERYRGGQAFYVSPRIEDLAEVKAYLDQNVPEARVTVAHGQMPPTMLEDIMSAFYDGKYDVLLSTTIIESGLDIPTANTLIVHRADMFGLSQLYQLRGRVGRSKTRAYALFTLPAQKRITAQAERRLKVIQSLDTLGAGFQLASHDLDIRGAGNLLGEEQSGHIKEVGFELYQQMLEEAVMSMKAGIAEAAEDRWSPQITIGMPVLIPEDYVADLRCGSGFIAGSPRSTRSARSTPSARSWSTGSVRCRRKCSICSRSSASRRCAGAPMSRRSMPGRRASCCRSATTSSPTRKGWWPTSARRAGREGAPRHARGVLRGLGQAGAAAQGHRPDPAHPGGDRREEEGGVSRFNCPAAPARGCRTARRRSGGGIPG